MDRPDGPGAVGANGGRQGGGRGPGPCPKSRAGHGDQFDVLYVYIEGSPGVGDGAVGPEAVGANGGRQVEVSRGASIVREPGGHGLPVDTSTVALRHLV